MRKGQETRLAIVEAAVEQAAVAGLEGLTIGALAQRMQMSKSGVFAHFGSREDLQIAVLQAYQSRFIADVLQASIPASRGLPRLVTLLQRWLSRTVIEASQGCLWISSASEYDDRPGQVRDELVRMIQGWREQLARAIRQAIEQGHLAPDTAVDDLIFGINGVVLVLHHDARLLRTPGSLDRACRAIDASIDRWRTDSAPAVRLVNAVSASVVSKTTSPSVSRSRVDAH